MVVRGSTQSPLYPIDFATLAALSSQPGMFTPQLRPLGQTQGGADAFSLDELPDDKKAELQRFVEANQDKFDGAVDTPEELRRLMQMLHQGEGKANGLPKLEGKGSSAADLKNMSSQEMLELLIEYLKNGGNQNEQNRPAPAPRMLGNLNGGGGSNGGGGGSMGGGGGVSNGGGGTASTGGTANTQGTNSVTPAGSLKGNDNAEKAFNYFVQKGLTKEQAAGIVGNLMVESGVDPNSNQHGGGPGRGIAQWSVGERWAQLEQFAQQTGRDPRALETQLDFMWKELTGSESAALNSLKATNSVADATVAFRRDYERAGIPHDDRRLDYAQQALSQFA